MHAKERLELCEARVSSRSNTEEDCTEELFDFLHARDHCVSVWRCRETSSLVFLMLILTGTFVFVGSTQAVSQREMTCPSNRTSSCKILATAENMNKSEQ